MNHKHTHEKLISHRPSDVDENLWARLVEIMMTEIENLNTELANALTSMANLEKAEADVKVKSDAAVAQAKTDMDSLTSQLSAAVKAQHDAETALVGMVSAADDAAMKQALIDATDKVKALEARIVALTPAV